MTEDKFKSYLVAADSVGGDYAAGYKRGLRRHYHGEGFGTLEEHELWLSLGSGSDARTELGEGYKDGFNGRPPRGFHAGLGNKNGQKYDLPQDSTIRFRINSQLKAKYIKQAKLDGYKYLTEWILKNCDDACK